MSKAIVKIVDENKNVFIARYKPEYLGNVLDEATIDEKRKWFESGQEKLYLSKLKPIGSIDCSGNIQQPIDFTMGCDFGEGGESAITSMEIVQGESVFRSAVFDSDHSRKLDLIGYLFYLSHKEKTPDRHKVILLKFKAGVWPEILPLRYKPIEWEDDAATVVSQAFKDGFVKVIIPFIEKTIKYWNYGR